MKLLLESEVPSPPDVRSYREAQWSSLAVGLLLFAIATAMIVLAATRSGGEFGWLLVLAAVIGIVLVKIGRYAFLIFFTSVMKTGWRLRWSSRGLYVRFRSPLNRHFADDVPIAVYLPWEEVDDVEPRREMLSVPDHRGSWTDQRRHAFLVVTLRGNTDTEPLRQALAAERQRRDQRGRRYEDYPVNLSPAGALKIRVLRPRRALDALGLAGGRPQEAPTPVSFEDMSAAERERHVRRLVDAGEFFAAVKAARRAHGLTLTQAKRWVDELRAPETGD